MIRVFLLIFFLALHSVNAHEALKDIVAKTQSKRVTMGTSIQYDALLKDAGYRELVIKNYDSITPEYYLKWNAIEQKKGAFDFFPLAKILNFAKENNLKVRGHTLFWHRSIPSWIRNERELEKFLFRYISRLVRFVKSQYPEKIQYWDVANEIFENNGLSRVFKGAKLINLVEKTFRMVNQLAPKDSLFYNEFGLENNEKKFDAVYHFLKKSINTKIPIHGIGLQFHLTTDRKYDWPVIEGRVKMLEELGLEVHITELDVKDTTGDLNTAKALYSQAISLCLKISRCTQITTWGATVKYSWLNDKARLPYSSNYLPNEIFESISNEFYKAHLRQNQKIAP